MFVYYDSGMSFRSVDPSYEAVDGEVLFPDLATPKELSAAFPGYASAMLVQAQVAYTQAAQSMLDTVARTRGYDGILSLCSYATSTNDRFRAEGAAGVTWRDAVWTEGYNVLAQVKAGTMAPPTLDEFLAMLPAMAWPE